MKGCKLATGPVVSLVLAAGCVSACGHSSTRDESAAAAGVTPTPAATATTAAAAGSGVTTLVGDSESTTGIVASQLGELVLVVNAGDASTNASATGLTGAITRTRACVANADKTATVTITYSGAETGTAGKYSVSDTAAGTETRIWSNSKSGNAVGCTANKLYAKIAWAVPASVDGLTLADTTARQRNVVTTFTNKQGVSKSRTADWTESGTRNVTWSVPAGATDATTTTKTFSTDVTKTYSLTKMDGTKKDLTAKHGTLTSDPMKVTVKRNATTGVPEKHTINSGTMTATKTGAFYVTNKFNELVFDLTSDDPCVPTSGSVTTSIYSAATDTTPAKTYTITFGSDGATVAGDQDATDNMNTNIDHKCDFRGGD